MSSSAKYQNQSRGSGANYERYLKGMDASMQQKVALTAAHLLGHGWLADMGMGSGTGSEALASLYPNIRVTGVDVNSEMVKRATDRYKLPNLDFRTGDIAEQCFEPESLDVIFNSSVLHHVTSFNNYRPEEAQRAIENQVSQLKTGGNLIIRDFLRPEDQQVVLELPPDTADLFRQFAREFRLLNPPEERGFPFSEQGKTVDKWHSFEVGHQHAVEFILRKDYTADWETEVQEEYTYFTQAQFERLFQQLGLRILASTPIRNPWIVSHRFRGKFRLRNSTGNGNELPYPATNYLIVGEKVRPGAGVQFRPGPEESPISYLNFAHYRHRSNGSLRDLIRRPNATLDVIPYYQVEDEVYVLARRSYPRPILSAAHASLDESRAPNYVTEPVVLIQKDLPLAQTVEEELYGRANISPDALRRFHLGSVSYPSPGGLQEQVQPVFVEIQPLEKAQGKEQVRALAARQLMRSAQVGGLPDARLELHCFELFQLLGRSPGSWIGETIELETHSTAPPNSDGRLPPETPRRAFVKAEQSAGFLKLVAQTFVEHSSGGNTVRSEVLEFVVPRTRSLNTLLAAPLWKTPDDIFLGLFDDDFPAAQCFSGHSNLWTTPAWRLPTSISCLSGAQEFAAERLKKQHGLDCRAWFQLGGPYYPSPGATPEAVYPLVCDVASVSSATEQLRWFSLRGLLAQFHILRDGHTKIALARLCRALAIDS